jgi:hypothetical protein
LTYIILAEENLNLKKNKIKDNDFLTKFEYASSLYFYPRDISCAKCHGIYGKKLIKFPFQSVYFKNFKAKNKNKYIIFPAISNLTKKEFINFFKKKKNVSFMPVYRLSDKEVELLYFYLKQVNSLKKQDK